MPDSSTSSSLEKISLKKDALVKIRELMAEHDIKVVTPKVAHVSDELLCDPIIWTADDMDGDNIPKGVSAEDAFNAFHDNGCYRMLEQRSLEEGQVILSDLITISLNEH